MLVLLLSVACRVASGTGAGLNVTAFTHTFPFYFSYDPPLVSKCSGVSAAGGMVHVTGSFSKYVSQFTLFLSESHGGKCPEQKCVVDISMKTNVRLSVLFFTQCCN